MEKTFDIFHKLHNGEKVICPYCNKGELIAPTADIQKTSHWYKCSVCGTNFEMCPPVTVE